MPLVSGFAPTALLAVGVALVSIILVVVLGIQALRRPLNEQNYRSAQWESRLSGTLAALAALVLGIALIGLVLWFVSGVLHGMSN
jgi:hypothetical protein